MLRPVDVRNAAEGEIHFNTNFVTKKIPNPVFRVLCTQIQKFFANSGYVNLTITFK
jgi:hypothetical protein